MKNCTLNMKRYTAHQLKFTDDNGKLLLKMDDPVEVVFYEHEKDIEKTREKNNKKFE